LTNEYPYKPPKVTSFTPEALSYSYS